jgi:hypothetical protein
MILCRRIQSAQTSAQPLPNGGGFVVSRAGESPMPRMRVCSQPECPTLGPNRRCDDHARQAEQRRGSRQQRGYDAEHDRLRARWKPKVERCEVDCARCGQRIWLGQAWHLDHTDDRTGYLGPSHQACNTSAGGKAAHAQDGAT